MKEKYRKLTPREEEFTKELIELLRKYDASITIGNEAMLIDVEEASEEPIYLPDEVLGDNDRLDLYLENSMKSNDKFFYD